MKILFADFSIAKYGGIISYMNSMIRAFKDLGHEIDIVQFTPSSNNQKSYDKKINSLKNGDFQKNIKINSQNGGYELTPLGYYANHYYGFLLPPSNRIGVYEEDALLRWYELVEDVDLILWNFMPTKSSSWENKRKFDFWWKFFDLPNEQIKQVFLSHDAYFDVRASHISALKKKILFLGCAHVAAYHCCENIGIPRALLLNPRYLQDDLEMEIIPMSERETDFFAAHIFKSMKHMEELIRCVPYLNPETYLDEIGDEVYDYSVVIAGSGIEQAYMVAKEKIKPCYICNVKTDPDLPQKLNGQISNWDRAENHGMNYLGQISSKTVNKFLKNSKFAVDPSWAAHYAQYCRTHINGFIIEAMLHGCYPVLRDYSGLSKNTTDSDPLFESIRAIYIPWDATPKQFAKALRKACNKISDEQYLEDTLHNFEIVKTLFNAKENVEEIVRLAEGGKKLVRKELEIGQDSENVKRISEEIMTGFFKIELPIIWET